MGRGSRRTHARHKSQAVAAGVSDKVFPLDQRATDPADDLAGIQAGGGVTGKPRAARQKPSGEWPTDEEGLFRLWWKTMPMKKDAVQRFDSLILYWQRERHLDWDATARLKAAVADLRHGESGNV